MGGIEIRSTGGVIPTATIEDNNNWSEMKKVREKHLPHDKQKVAMVIDQRIITVLKWQPC